MASRTSRTVLTLGMSKVTVSLVMLYVTFLVGRALGPNELGRWSLIAASGIMLHSFFVNWTHSPTVRFGREEWIKTSTINNTLGARFPIVALCLTIVVLLIISNPFSWQEAFFGLTPPDRPLVLLFFLSSWITAEAQSTVQAIDRINWQTFMGPVPPLVTLAVVAALILLNLPSLEHFVLALTLPSIICWGLLWILLLISHFTSFVNFSSFRIWDLLSFGLPMVPAFVFGFFSDWGDHVLLSRLSSMADVGTFAISYQIFLLIISANGLVTTILLPRLLGAYLQNPLSALKDYLQNDVPTIFSLSTIAMIWIVSLAPTAITTLSGPSFSGSQPTLLILLSAVPTSLLCSLYTILFNIQSRLSSLAFYIFLMSAVNFSFSAIFIPIIGAKGAALGTVISYFIVQIFYLRDQHRHLQVDHRQILFLYASALIVGFTQSIVGSELISRLLWAFIASLGFITAVRYGRFIDTYTIKLLFEPFPLLSRLVLRLLTL
jgi:O-antigen/teichoic acid export membrane protein